MSDEMRCGYCGAERADDCVCAEVLPTPPDAVAQAREALRQTLRAYVRIERGPEGGHPKTDRDIAHDDAANEQEIDAYRAAVVAPYEAEIARLREDAKRLDWLQGRYVATDFEYTLDDQMMTALIIHLPRSAKVGPDLRRTIDDATRGTTDE